MDESRRRLHRVMWAFIRAGWSPPPPSATATDRLLHDIENIQPQATLDLSPTQLRILHLLAAGLTYDQIAATLELPRETMRKHQKRIFQRLGARNAPHAVALGFRMGILE